MPKGKRGKGQAWSVDLVIGVLIFLLAVGTIYSLLNNQEQDDPTPLRIESEVIATILTNNASNQMLQVAENSQLKMDRLSDLAHQSETDYATLKKQLGIKNDFCIYLQNEDGDLVYIVDDLGNKYTGIGPGSDDFNLTEGNVPCGKQCVVDINGVCNPT